LRIRKGIEVGQSEGDHVLKLSGYLVERSGEPGISFRDACRWTARGFACCLGVFLLDQKSFGVDRFCKNVDGTDLIIDM
jgi:hypothetical protein